MATFIFSLKFKSSSFRSGLKRVFTHDAVYEFPRRPLLSSRVNNQLFHVKNIDPNYFVFFRGLYRESGRCLEAT